MKKLLLIMALATVSITTFTSCSKEETSKPSVTDVRDQSIGSYSFTIQGYVLNSDGTITAAGNPSAPLALTAEKGESNTILFKSNGVTQITGSKIATANDGFTFDISEQVFNNIAVTGWNGVTLGSVKYHGYYNSTTKNAVFYGKFTQDGQDGVLRFSGIKQ